MSQHDYIIADASGSAFLADLNLCVKALAENNYGTNEPAVMYAHMWWADTTADILKQRNAANTGWLSRYTLSTGALLGQGLGTPASGVLTNCTGTASALNIGGNAATATNGAYAWGTVNTIGTVTNSRNVTSATWLGTGQCTVQLSGTSSTSFCVIASAGYSSYNASASPAGGAGNIAVVTSDNAGALTSQAFNFVVFI